MLAKSQDDQKAVFSPEIVSRPCHDGTRNEESLSKYILVKLPHIRLRRALVLYIIYMIARFKSKS